MKIEIEDRIPNYKEVSDTVRLGPQKEILDDLDFINNRWMLTNWCYGNRSELKPLEPLHVTKTFRWGAGYKQKILDCIDTRFHQYNKPSGSIQTMFSRASNADWYKNQFVEKVLDLDSKLKRLRANSVAFHSNEDVLQEVYEKFLDRFDEQKAIAENISSSGDINIEIDMYRIPSYDIDTLRISGRELTQAEKDCVAYENTYVYQKYTWKKPVMDFVDRDGNLVYSYEIPEPIHMAFYFKVSEVINKMIHYDGDITKITSSTLSSSSNIHNRYQNSLSHRAGIRCVNIWGSGAGYEGAKEVIADPLRISSNYASSNTVIAYPYIGTRECVMPGGGVGNYIDHDKDHWKNVCHGDISSEFATCFLQMDTIGVLSLFNSWNVWHTTRSNPLQGINYMFLEKRPEMRAVWEQIGFRANDAHRRLSIMYQCYLGYWSTEVSLQDNFISLITIDSIEDSIVTYLENRSIYDEEYNNMWLNRYDVGDVGWFEEFLAEHLINARHAMMTHSSSHNCLEYANVTKEADTILFIDWISSEIVVEDDLPDDLPEFGDALEELTNENTRETLESLELLDGQVSNDLEREMSMWVNANTRRTNNG
tara:strand:- start:1440 stop:3218 length:1779 start_codon:yes stop_codon:yes gene_type:complete